MAEEKIKLQLTVEEAMTGDVGRGKVKIDDIAMKFLNIIPGDAIMITGKYPSVAIALPLHYDDYGKQIIRMDGWVRRNTCVSVGEKVDISKANIKDAEHIVIAPVKSNEIFSKNATNLIKQYLQNTRIPLGEGDLLPISIGLGVWKNLVVVQVIPQGFVMCSDYSTIEITYDSKAYSLKKKGAIKGISYEDLGGLKDITRKIREMIELPLKYPEVFKRLGMDPPRGILFYGPPGTGKTLLARAIGNETKAHFISLNGPEIIDKYYGESERKLRDIFKEANEKAPSIIFIDEIDSIAPKREVVRGDVEKRVVAQLLTLMDGLNSEHNVIVIGSTNRQNDIDSALRRPGRFDREIKFPVPNKKGRKEILTIHTRGMPLAKDVSLDEIARLIHGFVGADITALCREAAMTALRRANIFQKIDPERKEIPDGVLKNLYVEKADFLEAMKVVQPSVLRDVLIEKPNIRWMDIGGLEDIKQKLKEMTEWPITHPELFKDVGIMPPKGILIHGPPGTGKTLLAKAVATESEANFIAVNGPELLSMWLGETEKGIREIFRKARESAPCIIFFDEFDSIASARAEDTKVDTARTIIARTTVNQLLTELDGIKELDNVFVIAATNRPDMIDPALRRAGRFDREIKLPVPDVNAIREILAVHTKDMPLAKDVDLNEIAGSIHGFVGADIAALCREAVMSALRRTKIFQKTDIKTKEISKDALKNLYVEKNDFLDATKKISPSVLREVLIEKPNVKWSDIGGLEDIKQRLREMAEWPITHPGSFKNMGISPPKGIMLYGPPGTGKTMLAKAVATESEANFIVINGPELLSMWVGETEKGIREIFKKARQSSPCIIFFDEFDAVASVRTSYVSDTGSISRTIVNQLLTELDGMKPLDEVFVIAATNRLDIIDQALLRPGRLGTKILVYLPDEEARKSIFNVHAGKMPLADDVNIDLLNERADGFTGADIENLCREAGLNALRENMDAKEVMMKHFEDAFRKIAPSIPKNIAEYYQNIDKKMGEKEKDKQNYIL